jgi:hypothetical protein
MKNAFIQLFLGLTIISFSACQNENDSIDTTAIRKEMNERKVKKISEIEILEASLSKGKKVIDSLNTEKSITDESSNTDSLNQQYRMGAMQPVVDILQQINKAEIKKIIPSDLNAQSIRQTEKDIFEAYTYNISQGMRVNDNVQILDKYVFYSSPILDNGELKGMWSIYFDKGEIVKSIH